MSLSAKEAWSGPSIFNALENSDTQNLSQTLLDDEPAGIFMIKKIFDQKKDIMNIYLYGTILRYLYYHGKYTSINDFSFVKQYLSNYTN